jgi:predicted nucleotide-binding protein
MPTYNDFSHLVRAFVGFDPSNYSRAQQTKLVVWDRRARLARPNWDGKLLRLAVNGERARDARISGNVELLSGDSVPLDAQSDVTLALPEAPKKATVYVTLDETGPIDSWQGSLPVACATGLDAGSASGDDAEVPAEPEPDRKKVFIIHGRNLAARTAVEHFLKALKLEPIDFDALSSEMGTEFVGNIVVEGLRRAHGIVALFTPDESSALVPALRAAHDKPIDIMRWQSRPNVIFEAGIAFGIARKRSVIATLGSDVTLFSDVDGIHLLRLNNTVESRGKLRQRLLGMGCDLDQATTAWTDPTRSGDFETCVAALPEVSARDPFRT